jgi:hypothetical protein
VENSAYIGSMSVRQYGHDTCFRKVGGLWPADKPGAKWIFRGKINLMGRKLNITLFERKPNDTKEKAPVVIYVDVPRDMWMGWRKTADASDESMDSVLAGEVQ